MNTAQPILKPAVSAAATDTWTPATREVLDPTESALSELRAGIARWTRRALEAEAELHQARELLADIRAQTCFAIMPYRIGDRVDEYLNKEE